MPAQRAVATLQAGLDRTDAAATLARIFVLGEEAHESEVEIALPRLGLAGAIELGLLGTTAAGGVRALLDLRPYSFTDSRGFESWWIVSDLGELSRGGALDENHVLGVGGASQTLSGLMLQREATSVLDLGTGCGIQAMHAARHAHRVVATDISERALKLARINVELNEIDGVEFRLGSLFEPVAGERFDHIVSNPPFVITPRAEGVPAYEYRDGGMVGDALVEAVFRGSAEHLTPGGIAQMLGNWEYRTDAAGEKIDAFDRLREWLSCDAEGANGASGKALDYWIVEREQQSVSEYAETWIRDGGTRPGAEFDRLYDAWLDDFAARGVASVGFGYVLLRRSADSGYGGSGESSGPASQGEGDSHPARLERIERLHGPLGENEGGLGIHLDNCLIAHDAQALLSDAQLLATHLVMAADVTEERHYWPGADDPTAMILRQGGGFARAIGFDTALAALLGACDGELSVAAIVAALAQLLDVDEAALAAELLPQLRVLIDDGLVLLAEEPRN